MKNKKYLGQTRLLLFSLRNPGNALMMLLLILTPVSCVTDEPGEVPLDIGLLTASSLEVVIDYDKPTDEAVTFSWHAEKTATIHYELIFSSGVNTASVAVLSEVKKKFSHAEFNKILLDSLQLNVGEPSDVSVKVFAKVVSGNKVGHTEEIIISATASPQIPDVVTPVESNLIFNGGFDNESGWTIISHNTSGNGKLTIADGVATWDEAIDVPSGAWGSEAHMGAYQVVQVDEAGDYQFDLDIAINGFQEVWFQVWVGTTEPVEGADYGAPATMVLAANAWDCNDTQNSYSGSLAANSCNGTNGRISLNPGNYYVVIRSGGFTFGEGGIVIDNVSMEKTESIELIANGGFDDDSGWTIISHNASGNGSLTIADGVATWDEAIDVPSGAWGSEAHMGMYQAVQIDEAGDYQFDLDIAINGFQEVWFQVWVGTTQPVEGADYGDPATMVLAANAWDCQDAQGTYSGSLAANSCNGTNGIISLTPGTYYVVIRSGGFTFGTGGIVADNVSMEKVN